MKIITHPDPTLLTKGKKIKDVYDPEIQKLIQDMIRHVHEDKLAAGLAAQQVGYALQLCVLDIEGIIYVLINPKITNFSQERNIAEEGCLSFPGEFYPIERPESVKVMYLDQEGNRQKLKASGFLSRAIQHEIDHLNGILFIDKIATSTSQLEKLET